MADAYTSKASLTNLFAAAYDRKMRLALRGYPQFRTLATVKPANQTNPGDSVSFEIYGDLAEVTTTLNEATPEPDAVAIGNPTRISVTLAERGNYQVVTRLFSEFTLDPNSASNLANILAYNQAASLDTVVQNVLAGATQHLLRASGALTTSGAVSTVTGTDLMKSDMIRYSVAKLRAANTVPSRANFYRVDIHPEVSLDLRSETGPGTWRQPKEYAEPADLYAGEIGAWEGAVFVENSRCAQATTGASSARVFNTYVSGQECLAEAVAVEPHVVLDGVIIDPLKRKMAAGWYGILGWNLFRPEPLWLLQTTSSIHNT